MKNPTRLVIFLAVASSFATFAYRGTPFMAGWFFVTVGLCVVGFSFSGRRSFSQIERPQRGHRGDSHE